MDPRSFVHRVDASEIITHVNDAWEAFARENRADHLASEHVVGTSLWRHIGDLETKELYRAILARVRSKRLVLALPYRCDAPDRRRFMELRISPTGSDEVEFASRIVREEQRNPVRLLESDAERSDEFVRMCSWCKKVKTSDWVEVEEAVRELGLFHRLRLPQITHAICPNCLARLKASLAAAR